MSTSRTRLDVHYRCRVAPLRCGTVAKRVHVLQVAGAAVSGSKPAYESLSTISLTPTTGNHYPDGQSQAETLQPSIGIPTGGPRGKEVDGNGTSSRSVASAVRCLSQDLVAACCLVRQPTRKVNASSRGQ